MSEKNHKKFNQSNKKIEKDKRLKKLEKQLKANILKRKIAQKK